MEQDQVEKAVGLVQNAFATMARGEPVDHIQLKKDIQSAWPYGSRQYWSAKGGKSKAGGGYEYDPEMDTPTYFENLQKTIREEIEALLDEEKENNPWAICTASVGREDKEKYEKCVKSVKKQNRSKE